MNGLFRWIKRNFFVIALFLVSFVGLFLRLYKISFGLPYSFIADETDIYDEVIRYSLNYKFINSLEGFAPTSYVYGMFPTYFLTLCVMVLNKFISVVKLPIDFDFYFVYMRIVTSIFSMSIVFFSYLIFKKLFKEIKEKNNFSYLLGLLIITFLSALNWKLIAHSHYLNQDTYLAVLSLASSYFFLNYLKPKNEKKRVVNILLSAILFGFAVGTKITALIVFPLVVFCFVVNKDIKALISYTLGTVFSFVLSNPFSAINFSSFYSRIMLMRTVEAGVVFNSVDTNPLKYLLSLSYQSTIPVFLFSVFGVYLVLKNTFNKHLFKLKNIKENIDHTYLLGYILIYILFFSINIRLIDRWVLPILPIILIYSAYGISSFWYREDVKRSLKIIILGISLVVYLLYPISLVKQLYIGKPRVNAYLWAKDFFSSKDNIGKKILMYSNKPYKDPFKKIEGCEVQGFNVYESRGAATSYPKNPYLYDYIIIYSTMNKSFKNKYIQKKYPEYSRRWSEFEYTIENSVDFSLVNDFPTTKLNLLDIPGISIYKRN